MGERLTVRVLRMAPEGQAVAKADSSPRVIFVAGGAPGDLLEVEVVTAKSSFARAQIVKLVKPGPERITPPMPVALRSGAARACLRRLRLAAP